jgi:hypothetical protein
MMNARTPLEATRRFLDEAKLLDEQAHDRVTFLTRDLRREIATRLASARDYEAYRLPSLSADIERAMSDFRDRYLAESRGIFRDYAALGQASVDAPLQSVGIEMQLPASSLSVFQIAQRFNASLIQYVTEDTIAKITREVSLAVTGVQSPFEAIKKIERQIDDPLQFGSLQNRAETILRTEAGRVQSMAAQARLEDAKTIVPGLQKQWLWSGVSRRQHAAIHGQVRDVDKPYDIPGAGRCPEDRLLFPRDPSGLACQTINCGCQSIPYKKEWNLDLAA